MMTLAEVQCFGALEHSVGGGVVERSVAQEFGDGRPDVDQRPGERPVARVGITVEQGDVGVGGEPAVAVELEHRADAFHAESVELGGAERTHRGCSEDTHPFVDRTQDLLVPHRQALAELSVDDQHCHR